MYFLNNTRVLLGQCRGIRMISQHKHNEIFCFTFVQTTSYFDNDCCFRVIMKTLRMVYFICNIPTGLQPSYSSKRMRIINIIIVRITFFFRTIIFNTTYLFDILKSPGQLYMHILLLDTILYAYVKLNNKPIRVIICDFVE